MANLYESKIQKPTLNRQVLSSHGITFEESFNQDNPIEGLPEHVALLGDALLDFEALFESTTKPELEGIHKRETTNKSLYPFPPNRSYILPNLNPISPLAFL